MESSRPPPITPKTEYSAEFGKTLIIGATGGLGHAVTQAFHDGGCPVYATSRSPNKGLEAIGVTKVIPHIDVTQEDCPQKLVEALGDVHLDTVLVVAGCLVTEKFGESDRKAELTMFDTCAIGPLRCVEALVVSGKIRECNRVGFITSEGGSIGLRTEKEGGGSYGHHGSKAAQNMMCKMLSFDLKPRGIAVVMIHPGFLKTAMTGAFLTDKYEELGAVLPEVAAPYIIDCLARLNLDNTGRFVAALGAYSLGLGLYALKDPSKLQPGDDLPW